MDIFFAFLTIAGLAVFESVSSIDNAVINAEVLSTMGKKARRFFLTWGIFFAVFVVRGTLPFLIVWAVIPSLSAWEVVSAAWSGEEGVHEAVVTSAPLLLMGGGIFLLFLFFHWLFLEPKKLGLFGESFFLKQGGWFYAIVSVILATVIWHALKQNDLLAFGAVVGSTSFFIIHGFREHAEKTEKTLISPGLSDLSKIFYLEAIDVSFSIDGVLGAFAFTFAIPLILIGNGIGAIIVRQMTVSNIDRIRRYAFLKNGAMYSIFFLGLFMVLSAFGIHVPEWFSPVVTFLIIGYFFHKSRAYASRQVSALPIT